MKMLNLSVFVKVRISKKENRIDLFEELKRKNLENLGVEIQTKHLQKIFNFRKAILFLQIQAKISQTSFYNRATTLCRPTNRNITKRQ